MPEPGIPGTIRLLKTKAIMSTARKCQGFVSKEPDSAAPVLFGGLGRGMRRPLCDHLDTALRGQSAVGRSPKT